MAHELLLSVELTKESVSEYEVVLDTTLTVPLVLCPFCVASTVYVPVSVTVKDTVPVLVFVCKVEPPFLSVTVAPDGAVSPHRWSYSPTPRPRP